MTELFNKNSELGKRRSLRNSAPRAERIVWSRLRKNQVLGFKFRRQYSVGPYVIDFYCPVLSLAVEIDGDSHFQQDSNDKNRQDYIERFGIRFLRFTNEEVYKNLDGVLEAIRQAAEEGTPTHQERKVPSLRRRGFRVGRTPWRRRPPVVPLLKGDGVSPASWPIHANQCYNGNPNQ